jgi:hypothetical protein
VKNSIKKYFPYLIFFALIFAACNDDITFQPQGSYISGYASFIDTNYLYHKGHYAVALYPIESPPFYSQPVECQLINMNEGGNPYYFRISHDGKGCFYLAVVWKIDSTNYYAPILLGTFGCDTSHSCTNHKIVEFPNFTGFDYNITCWSDTSKRLF